MSFIRWLLEGLRPGLTPSHSGQAEFRACATADRSAAPLSLCLAFAFIFSFFLIPSFVGGGESPEQKAALEEAGKLHKEAGAFRQSGKLSEAAAFYIRAAIIREKVLGPEHPDVATSLNFLGSVYNERRQYALAESVHKRALAIREKVLGPEHLEVAISLNNLAVVYYNQGRHAESEPLYKRALTIREKLLGSEHLGVALILNNLGNLYRTQGRYAEAVPLYRRVAAIREKLLGPEHHDLLRALTDLAGTFHAAKNYSEAEALWKRVLATWLKSPGLEDRYVAASLMDLAELYRAQGRYVEAEPLLEHLFKLDGVYAKQSRYTEAARSLGVQIAIKENISGTRSPNLVFALGELAKINRLRARYSDAEAGYLRALAILEEELAGHDLADIPRTGFDDVRIRAIELMSFIRKLAELYVELGRYAEAESLYRRAISLNLPISSKTRSEDQRTLARLYVKLSRYLEAEKLLLEELSRFENYRKGSEEPGAFTGDTGIAEVFMALAELYDALGRWAEAEPLFKRAFELREWSFQRSTRFFEGLKLGEWSWPLLGGYKETLDSLIKLIDLYVKQKRLAEAWTLYERGYAIIFGLPSDWSKKEGHKERIVQRINERLNAVLAKKAWYPQLPEFIHRFADMRLTRGDAQGARSDHMLALAVREAGLGREHPDVAKSLNSLASFHIGHGDKAEAETLLKRALAIQEKILGADHPDVADTLSRLGDLYNKREDWTAAAASLKRAVQIQEKTFGPETDAALGNLMVLGTVLFRDKQYAAARQVNSRLVSAIASISRNNPEVVDSPLRAFFKQASWLHFQTRLLVYIGRRSEIGVSGPPPFTEAFMLSEMARNRAAQAALAKASARAASLDASAAEMARRVQNLRNRLQAVREQLLAEYSKPSNAHSPERLERLAQERKTLDENLARATRALYEAFPRYAEISSADPVDQDAVRRLLRPDEALLSYMSFPEELLIWFVRREAVPLYIFIPIKKPDLRRLVTSVRASLDQSQNADFEFGLKPFDVAGAHELYKLLIERFREDLEGVKHLIIVLDEALLPLPFGALVTKGEGEDYRKLVSMHENKQLLDSLEHSEELASYGRLSWLAREYAMTVLPSATSLRALRQIAPRKTPDAEPLIAFGDPVLEGRGRQRGGKMLASRGVRAPVEEIRKLDRLPGTRMELESVAKALGAEVKKALYLDKQVTKPVVMKLNGSGRLGKAEVVAFATHGLIAGELTGLKEPALVLTPPKEPTEEDNGLLGLEDILSLKLDSAEWVILSACNTAAADGSGEGLSGLVRAFFFSGARSLLVSHWSVDDRATQALMTEIFQRYAKDKTMPRAEALRRGMLALMERAKGDTAYFAHPFAWAPFFLVGEGSGTIK